MRWLKLFMKELGRMVGSMLLVLVLGYLFGVGFVNAWRAYQPEVHVVVVPGRTA